MKEKYNLIRSLAKAKGLQLHISMKDSFSTERKMEMENKYKQLENLKGMSMRVVGKMITEMVMVY